MGEREIVIASWLDAIAHAGTAKLVRLTTLDLPCCGAPRRMVPWLGKQAISATSKTQLDADRRNDQHPAWIACSQDRWLQQLITN